ncbi:MAG: hypothetical protein NTV01_12680, partial [Bacteroidia bacterium]|nr:hypothetical protein [Bacteroidia bacterium]
QLIMKTREILASEITIEPDITGLLALRSDRGERSRQWLDYLKAEGKDLFSRIWVSGIHSPIFTRKLKNCERLIAKNPEMITRHIIESTKDDLIVFGIGNIHGLGMELLNHWNNQHQAHLNL